MADWRGRIAQRCHRDGQGRHLVRSMVSVRCTVHTRRKVCTHLVSWQNLANINKQNIATVDLDRSINMAPLKELIAGQRNAIISVKRNSVKLTKIAKNKGISYNTVRST